MLTLFVLTCICVGANVGGIGVASLRGAGLADRGLGLALAVGALTLGAVFSLFVLPELPLSALSLSAPFSWAMGMSLFLTVGAISALATILKLPIHPINTLLGGFLGVAAIEASAASVATVYGLWCVPLALAIVVGAGFAVILGYIVRAMTRSIHKKAILMFGRHTLATMPYSENPTVMTAVLMSQMRGTETPVMGESRDLGIVNVYHGSFLRLPSEIWLPRLHFLSAGFLTFMMGLMVTPMLTTTLMQVKGLQIAPSWALVLATSGLIIGSLGFCDRIASHLGKGFTRLSGTDALSVSLGASFAIGLGLLIQLPFGVAQAVGGSFFGHMTHTGRGNFEQVVYMVLAWVVALPLAGAMTVLFYWGLKDMML